MGKTDSKGRKRKSKGYIARRKHIAAVLLVLWYEREAKKRNKERAKESK